MGVLPMAIHLLAKIAIGEWPVQTQFWTDHNPNLELTLAQYGPLWPILYGIGPNPYLELILTLVRTGP